MVFFLHPMNVFVHKMKPEFPELKKVVTLSKISLRSISRFFILLAQNDRPFRSFRLRGRSTSSSFRKSLSDQKGARGASVQMPPPPTSLVCGVHL